MKKTHNSWSRPSENIWMHRALHMWVITPKWTNCGKDISGLILDLRLANERRRYFVTTSLIGWAQTWNQPCICMESDLSGIGNTIV